MLVRGPRGLDAACPHAGPRSGEGGAAGIWIGSRARVSADAELIAPCWVGDQVVVEAGAVVGGGAILEDRSVVGRGHRHRRAGSAPERPSAR